MAENPNPSHLDHQQILQRVFDKDNDALRTDAFVQVDSIGADLVVDIDASTGDNIAIANEDGSKKVTITTVGPIEALDVNVAQSVLPDGAATEAKQDIGNASLASIDSDIDVSLSTRASESTLSTLNNKISNDYGSSSGAVRTASQIGNTTGQAAFNAGITNPQTLRVVLPTDQTAIPASQSGTWNINNISGTISLPTGAATSANQTTQITSLQILDDVPAGMNDAFNKGNTIMGQLDDTSTTAATENNVAPVRITAQRAIHTNLRNNAGTEIGTSSNPIRNDPTGTTAQPVTDNAGSLTIDTPQLATTLGQKTMANSAAVVVASDQVLNVTTITSNKIIYEDITTIARGATIAVGAFVTVYSYTGSGLFHGFSIGMTTATSNWRIRLLIDGTHEIFGATGLSTDDMNSASIYNIPSIAQSPLPSLGFILSATNIQWGPSNNIPITYTSSVSILLQRAVSSKVFNGGLAILTKVT